MGTALCAEYVKPHIARNDVVTVISYFIAGGIVKGAIGRLIDYSANVF